MIRIIRQNVTQIFQNSEAQRIAVLRHEENIAPAIAPHFFGELSERGCIFVRLRQAFGSRPWRSPPEMTGSKTDAASCAAFLFSSHGRRPFSSIACTKARLRDKNALTCRDVSLGANVILIPHIG